MRRKQRDSHEPHPAARWLRLPVAILLLVLLALPATASATDGLAVSLSPASQSVAVGGLATVTATVTYNGVPRQFAPVQFSIISGPNTGTGTTTPIYTNQLGQASFSYTSGAGGTDTVFAQTSIFGSGTATSSATVTWTGSSIATSLTLASSSYAPAVGTSVTLTATVEDSVGNPVSGVAVYFNITGANPINGSDSTDVNGDATFSYTGTNTGTDTVLAWADLNGTGVQDSGEPSDSVTITWGGAVTLTLTPSSQAVQVGTQATVTATLTNVGGAIANIPIHFTVTGANPTSGTDTTDASGDATFSYTGSNTGTSTITAWADLNKNGVQNSGEPVVTATVRWTNLTLSPTTQSIQVGTQASVTATLTNPGGSIMSIPIRFSVNGANPTSSTLGTNASGQATFSYTGSITGTDTITAYADLNGNNVQNSGEPSATATVTYTSAASLTLTPAAQSLQVGGSATVTATLTNPGGSINNVAIRFTVTGANPTSGSAATNTSGQTTFSYTGANSGSDTITAYADLNGNSVQDSGEPSASATAGWTAAPAPPPQPFGPAQPAAPKANCTYFPETQHNLCAGFQAYWNQFGGLATYGMPISEEFVEKNPDTGQLYTVQYFERARFEWHPGAYPSHFDVLLGLLGDEVTAGRSNETPFQRTSPKLASNCQYFAATGHNLCAGFNAYWQQFGGLATYGMPISEEFVEKNPDTGQLYTVQYFERARFEWHPGEFPQRFDVLLGRLGAQVLSMRYDVPY